MQSVAWSSVRLNNLVFIYVLYCVFKYIFLHSKYLVEFLTVLSFTLWEKGREVACVWICTSMVIWLEDLHFFFFSWPNVVFLFSGYVNIYFATKTAFFLWTLLFQLVKIVTQQNQIINFIFIKLSSQLPLKNTWLLDLVSVFENCFLKTFFSRLLWNKRNFRWLVV